MYGATEGYGLYQNTLKLSELKEDRSEINKVNYGLFNLDLWKEKLMVIFDSKIGDFSISPKVYKDLEGQAMIYLTNVYDEYIGSGKLVEEMIAEAEKSSSINKIFLALIKGNIGTQIKKLNIDKQLPKIAKAITKEIKKNEHQIKYYMTEGVQDMLFAGAEDIEIVDPRMSVYKKYNSESLETTNTAIDAQIDALNPTIDRDIQKVWIILFASLIIGIVLYKWLGFTLFISHLTVVSIVLLILGVSMPMIDLDARLNAFEMDVLASKIRFDEQVIYYQSKSILQVTKTLLRGRGADLKIVGYMILLFSIIIPFIKLLLSSLFLFSKKVSQSRLAKGIIFHLGKWSMADVFVVALFMSYIGMNGLITAQLGDIARNETGFAIETLNYSRLAPGALFFTSYCIISIILGILINRHDRITTIDN